jgi:hypothetical protein
MGVQSTLLRIHAILDHQGAEDAGWLASVIDLGHSDSGECYRQLGSKRVWGGAGSIASRAMVDNPGRDERLWRAEIREFRELMIELGDELKARGYEHPDMSSWLLAFNNWNQSDV